MSFGKEPLQMFPVLKGATSIDIPAKRSVGINATPAGNNDRRPKSRVDQRVPMVQASLEGGRQNGTSTNITRSFCPCGRLGDCDFPNRST